MRVVLVRLSALGDVVHTWPLAVALRRACPNLCLTWVVEEPLRDLVLGHPAVDAVVTVNTRRWRRAPFSARTLSEVRATRESLRRLAPELAIDPQGLAKSALLAYWTGAQRRVGLRRPWRRERLAGLAYTETVSGSTTSPHVVATNLELVRSLGASPPAEPPRPDGTWLLSHERRADLALTWGAPYAVVLVGAGQPDKALPRSTLAEVSRGLAGMGLTAIVAWGPGEREAADSVVTLAGRGAHLAPPTNLRQLAWLLAQAAVVVGADTGPLHLAASLGAPTVAVFLTTSGRRNGPLGQRVALVSAVAEEGDPRRGSAAARTVRRVGTTEILDSVHRLLDPGVETP